MDDAVSVWAASKNESFIFQTKNEPNIIYRVHFDSSNFMFKFETFIFTQTYTLTQLNMISYKSNDKNK